MSEKIQTFDQWWSEIENFAMRGERLSDMLSKAALAQVAYDEGVAAALATPTSEELRDLREADDMLREIGAMCRDQTLFVGSYADIVRQALATQPQAPQVAVTDKDGWIYTNGVKPKDLSFDDRIDLLFADGDTVLNDRAHGWDFSLDNGAANITAGRRAAPETPEGDKP